MTTFNETYRIRLVHEGAERLFDARDLGITNPLDNEQVLQALQRRLDLKLEGYAISRFNANVLVAPAPVFG